MFLDTSVPVVVVNSYHHGSLGIARSLGRLGINVYGIDSNKRALGLKSKYFKQKFICDIDQASEKTVKCLLEVAKRIGKRCILMPTYDEGVVTVAEYADVLKKYYIFPDVSKGIIKALTSKKEMYFLAKELGIPTAETSFPKSQEDVLKYLEHASFPIMLKGIHSKETSLRCGTKMFLTKTKKELLDLYNRYENFPNPIFMLQEFIPGEDDTIWMLNAYFNEDSKCLFAITGKKIRQTPPHVGCTSLGVCMRNDEIFEMTKKIVQKIGYKGIIDIGYRFDKRDGKYKVLDINPRIGCTFRLFVADNGLDVARAGYIDLTGQTIPPWHGMNNRKWILENEDFYSSIQYFFERKLSFKDWLASFGGVKETAWFAPDDLYPFFYMLGNNAACLVSRAHNFFNRKGI